MGVLAALPFIGYMFHKLRAWWHRTFNHKKSECLSAHHHCETPISMKKKWHITSRNTGFDFGIFDGTNVEEALEAFAVKTAEEDKMSIGLARQLISEGNYSVLEVKG